MKSTETRLCVCFFQFLPRTRRWLPIPPVQYWRAALFLCPVGAVPTPRWPTTPGTETTWRKRRPGRAWFWAASTWDVVVIITVKQKMPSEKTHQQLSIWTFSVSGFDTVKMLIYRTECFQCAQTWSGARTPSGSETVWSVNSDVLSCFVTTFKSFLCQRSMMTELCCESTCVPLCWFMCGGLFGLCQDVISNHRK